MAGFLTEEWIDAVRGVAGELGDVSVECAVTGGPAGDVRLHATPGEVGLGGSPGAAVSLTVPYAEAVAIARGELEPSVAFMQGRMKTAGDPGRLLDLLAATATAGFRAARERVAGSTEF